MRKADGPGPCCPTNMSTTCFRMKLTIWTEKVEKETVRTGLMNQWINQLEDHFLLNFLLCVLKVNLL